MSTILGDLPISTANQLFFMIMLNLIPLAIWAVWISNNAGGIGNRNVAPCTQHDIRCQETRLSYKHPDRERVTSMSIPSLDVAKQWRRINWAGISLLAYGAMCVGLLGYFIVYPDRKTQTLQLDARLKADPARPAKAIGGSDAMGEDRYRLRSRRADTQ